MTLFSANREKFNLVLERVSRAADEMRVFGALCAPVDASLGAYLSAGSDAELGAARRQLSRCLARYPAVGDARETPIFGESSHRLCVWFRGATRNLNFVRVSEADDADDSCEQYASRFVDNRVEATLLADMVFESVKLGATMPPWLRHLNSVAVLFESAEHRLYAYRADESARDDDSNNAEENLFDVLNACDENLQRAAWLLFDEIVQSGDDRFKFPNDTFEAGLGAHYRLHPTTQDSNWPIAIALTEERQRQRDAELAAFCQKPRSKKKKRRANKK